ncbi:phosphatase PAP2 family protein [Streptomyces sp. NBC_00102]|uniref:phosphatase PAP2 family protein n=1 Tax=Streptomyces sp. NBC_00102 TaxID=2975652 RepID=UPI00224F8423|nr:phosphatase PAP2 family protein [Streptomyces sp. NBC_00102]MCX5396622.1 phosphatase PAP2 family protein [Streptomyces sp. NBC_00102]
MGDSQVSTQEGPSVACPSPTKDKTDSTGDHGRKGLTARLRGTRSPRRPRLWFEVLLIGVSYWLYSLVRNAVPEQRSAALRNADWVWSFENTLGAGFEHSVNHAVNSVTWLIVSMNYYYATLHFIVTIGVLVWLFRSHPGRYAATRLVLFATTGVALLGYYLVPLAPPRLMNGGTFVDTVLVHHTWGSMASGNLKNMSNQYAAMPSMHIGWSLWCGLTIFALASVPWVRVLGLLYPVATLVVIVSTANHFWLDAVGGMVCLSFGFAVAYVVYGTLPHRLARRVEPPRTPLRTRLVGLGTARGRFAAVRAPGWAAASPAARDASAAEPGTKPAATPVTKPAATPVPAPTGTAATETPGAPGRR